MSNTIKAAVGSFIVGTALALSANLGVPNNPHASVRSPDWHKAEAAHLVRQPKCACCGGTKKRQVHHIQPFHDKPELELDPNNMITLCTDGPCNLNCHFVIGHLGNTKCSNPNVVEDAAYMLSRFSSRKCD